LNLEETVKKCQSGDTQAFRELFSEIESKAIGTAYLISGKRGLAEDIVQESFIRCLESINALKTPEAFNVWFYRILVHTGWKMMKKQTRIIPTDILPQSAFQNIEENAYASILNEKLHKAISELSSNLKNVVVLYYFNGMSIEEIAKITKNLKPTVKTRLYYARNALRKKLESDMTVSEKRYEVKSSFKNA
jgi:RNA polymerase sigma-70 factor (ECF subfamily)